MKVLQLTQVLMKVCGALPIFSSSFEGKCLETLKLVVLYVCPVYVAISTFLYFTFYSDNFSLMTTAMYICTGYSMGIFLQISYFLQTNRMKRLLSQLEILVNKRKKYVFFSQFYEY